MCLNEILTIQSDIKANQVKLFTISSTTQFLAHAEAKIYLRRVKPASVTEF
jgi:hypothetical protein